MNVFSNYNSCECHSILDLTQCITTCRAEISDGSDSKRNKLTFSSNNNCYCRVGVVLLVLLVLATVIGLSIGLGTYYGLKDSAKESLVDAITTADLKELLLVCTAIAHYLIVCLRFPIFQNLQDTAVNNRYI